MDKEIKSINEVQDAEEEAKKILEKALSQKQKLIDEANKKAREMVEGAEAEAKELAQRQSAAAMKEIEGMKNNEAKVTKKMVDDVKKKTLSQTSIKKLAEKISKNIAGE